MQVYKTPIREYKFLLEDFLNLITIRPLQIEV